MTEPIANPGGVTDEQVRAALAVIKSTGISIADAEAAHALALPAFRNAPRTDPVPTCHRCQAPATVQWQRHATADEAETWHAGREQWIRQHNDGRPEAGYVADRSDTVTVAVHGCGEHPDPCPGRVHDADCKGHGSCRCVLDGGEPDDATRARLAEERRAHIEAFEAAREAGRAE